MNRKASMKPSSVHYDEVLLQEIITYFDFVDIVHKWFTWKKNSYKMMSEIDICNDKVLF